MYLINKVTDTGSPYVNLNLVWPRTYYVYYVYKAGLKLEDLSVSAFQCWEEYITMPGSFIHFFFPSSNSIVLLRITSNDTDRD